MNIISMIVLISCRTHATAKWTLTYVKCITPTVYGDTALALDPTRSSIIRQASTEEGTSGPRINIDNRLIHKFTTGQVEHTLLTGIDCQSIDIDSKDYAADPIIGDGNSLLPVPNWQGNIPGNF
ncbi:hypothetical protein O9992_18375 [Vibrio lentus]|nr:hypothetical protein [Vibrio lentus]